MNVFLIIILQVVGIGLIATGMWMNIDLNVKAYLIVFRRYPEDDLLVAGAACFIVAGLLTCGICACVVLALFKRMSFLLLIVSYFDISIYTKTLIQYRIVVYCASMIISLFECMPFILLSGEFEHFNLTWRNKVFELSIKEMLYELMSLLKLWMPRKYLSWYFTKFKVQRYSYNINDHINTYVYSNFTN